MTGRSSPTSSQYLERRQSGRTFRGPTPKPHSRLDGAENGSHFGGGVIWRPRARCSGKRLASEVVSVGSWFEDYVNQIDARRMRRRKHLAESIEKPYWHSDAFAKDFRPPRSPRLRRRIRGRQRRVCQLDIPGEHRRRLWTAEPHRHPAGAVHTRDVPAGDTEALSRAHVPSQRHAGIRIANAFRRSRRRAAADLPFLKPAASHQLDTLDERRTPGSANVPRLFRGKARCQASHAFAERRNAKDATSSGTATAAPNKAHSHAANRGSPA